MLEKCDRNPGQMLEKCDRKCRYFLGNKCLRNRKDVLMTTEIWSTKYDLPQKYGQQLSAK